MQCRRAELSIGGGLRGRRFVTCGPGCLAGVLRSSNARLRSIKGTERCERRAAWLFDRCSKQSRQLGCMISKEPFRQISNIYIALRYAPEPAGVARDKFAKEARAFAVRR